MQRHPSEAGRRQALRALAGFLAGSPLLRSQTDPLRYRDRVPGFSELATAFDFEAVAYARLPRAAYDYPASYTDSGFTKRRNREAFDWVEFVPGKLVGRAASRRPRPKSSVPKWRFP